ncbi:CQS_1a_G0034340.mRNA.1.CDS.1 [Saccharomyces cerevisiae]|nr:CQS_1a_G0034340.mRNA.1.CDS.1 [Saccharomyces cerevisiae]CAI7396749.1 CQS_1a_G0034340.mRNA.1.CDS.1 [Saccharomyces cerevisiae]
MNKRTQEYKNTRAIMSATLFTNIELLPPDALFGIKQRYGQDQRVTKVDLGIGAYRDDNGKPWVLPSVKAAEKLIHNDSSYNHEYLGITGLPSLTSNAAKIIFGTQSDALQEDRVISVQSLSGTGALHISAKFFSKFFPDKLVYLSKPTWANHMAIFENQGLKTATYPYWANETKSLDLNGFLNAIQKAPEGSIFVLHSCAHNPTGLDPTSEQWVQIVDAIASKNHIALFDTAYQGFATGDLDKDAYAVRLGVEKLSTVSPVFVCQSFAKNAGMYGERVGCFHLALTKQAQNKTIKPAVTSQLAKIIRSEVSNPPAYGAKIVAKLLETPELTEQWHKDMVTMSSRITKMRHALRDHLVKLGTPGNWDHIVNQCGMFSFTGLTPQMVKRLEETHAVYLVASGRASIAGLNQGNVEYVAKAIDEVVRFYATEAKL